MIDREIWLELKKLKSNKIMITYDIVRSRVIHDSLKFSSPALPLSKKERHGAVLSKVALLIVRVAALSLHKL
jgi:hypothetical protein